MKRLGMTLRTVAAALGILLACTPLVRGDPSLLDNWNFSADIRHEDNPSDLTGNWVANEPSVCWRPTAPGEGYVEFWIVGGTDPSPYPSYELWLQQEVTDLSPGPYSLSFYYNFLSTGVAQECDLFYYSLLGATDLAGNELGDILIASNHEDPADSGTKSLTFDVTDGSLLVSFWLMRTASTKPGDIALETSVRIDNVRLAVVPVPGAVLLGGIGLGYAGLRLRRRTRTAA